MANEAAITVFIVDDSLIVRERLLTMISEVPGTEIVGQAGLAVDALAGIREFKPDVVVLDISIPGGNGMQVLEKIKKEKPAPLAIMLTNFAHEQYRQRCVQLGADYFFDKTSEFEKVLEVLRDLAAPDRQLQVS